MQSKPFTIFRTYLLTSLLYLLPSYSYSLENQTLYTQYDFDYSHLLGPKIFTEVPDGHNTLGALRSNSDSLIIACYNDVLCSQQSSKSNGGVIDAQTLVLSNNTGVLQFIGNTALGQGGAVNTTADCEIINNSCEQYFIRNQAISEQSSSNLKNYGGAVFCGKDLTISQNRKTICFGYNLAKSQGGAITATKNVYVTKNSCPILLINNNAFETGDTNYGKGGAIYCENCEFSDNSGPIYLVSNSAPQGGACKVTSLSITKNSGAIFFANNSSLNNKKDNNAKGISGGAVLCSSCNIEKNPGVTCFDNNAAFIQGGAISCKNLTIKESGPVQFTNNHSTYGGAVLLENNGILDLSADYGDIIFNNNYAADNLWYRNAWHCTSHVTTKLGAKKHRSIKIYDPIETIHENCSITINPEDYHKGTVLFSSLSVPEALTAEKNFFSYIKNPLTIKNGVLAVEDKAGIAAYKITQEQGSILRLGNRAIITTNTQKTPASSSGAQIIINRLALNLPSIIQNGAEAPKIWIYPTKTGTNYKEDTNPTITISGPLLLLDSDNNDPFDSLDLSGGITKVPFLYLCDNENKKITVTDLNIEAINDSVHYGYQGIWSPYWEEYSSAGGQTLETANKSHRMLYADWTPTYYIPNPKFKTPLVANALWQTFYTTMSGLQSLPSITLGEQESAFEFSGQGLGITVRQRTKNQIYGFRMESAGYAVGTSSRTLENQKLAFAFSQHFSQVQEKISDNKLSTKNYFGGMQVHFPLFNERILTSGSLAYCYGDHKLKNFYKEDDKASQGSFYSHSFAATINCFLPFLFIGNEFTLAPFVEAIAFRSTISSFEETGDFIRKFSSLRPLRTLTTPVGIAMQWEQNSNTPTIWKLELAYKPIVHKQYPKILTTLLASNGMWASYGTPITRHSFTTSLNNETLIFNNLKIFMNYHGEISSSTFSNYLKAGSSMHF
ncbi:polymorphic outer membrane protein middle domain-containing protein [Chlamydia vaughanii]|uniref:polymorphic outer membrane protein middle domain-containing protein n=1 Tax=Chlamydia vaughanii TaxID=3112552 RepID=UPI0032B1E7FA